ncbi:cbb3-type cytochrome c oxidase N-terminal domain-containing protein [Tunicatimonas pelagia]|uniref:cbb3-type cytochrome c oxidase N-terminal domain-containing protein n=1 Tax=Tunicatimonas pelagia TaxID=931531 RepID=UPI002666C27A|nr:cbb3-type cytochrome c oxidase N-terminal domain-containing protein [Tunicatimonas pelagia]WKN41137.1 cbb3-type cytochrome c oxidase N-terminal domain-containing protein [Tunicatimonas pelagia]
MKRFINHRKRILPWLIGALLPFLPVIATAQEAAPASNMGMSNIEQYIVWGLMGLEVVLLIVVVILLVVIKMMSNVLFPTSKVSPSGELVEPDKPWYQKFLTQVNDAVPIEREAEVMTTHEYDGIYELDNNLPPWWKAMFYVTIVFAVVYLLYFHVFSLGSFQEEEYEQEMAQAKLEVDAYLATAGNSVDETNVTFISDAGRLDAAQKMFAQKCSACHGMAGEGGVGPNLTDTYWIHGGDVKDIFRIIKNGVPEKGMIPWKSQLSPVEMQDLSSYIITLEGTEPPNAKEPQGEPYERDEELALN